MKSVTVLIGRNGTGKSNLMEAIIIIFRNLDLEESPKFVYKLRYICRGHTIEISANPTNIDHTKIVIDNEKISISKFYKNKISYLPNHVFAYHSGSSSILEPHFNDHLNKSLKDFKNELDVPLRRLFYARDLLSQFVLLSFFSFQDENAQKFLKDYFDISNLDSVLFILKEPKNWMNDGAINGDKRFWNATSLASEFLGEIYSNSLAPIRDKGEIALKFDKRTEVEFLYLFIPNDKSFRKATEKYGNQKLLNTLEMIYSAGLIHKIYIKVETRNIKKLLTFEDLSDGEQQLLTVLGLLKFTKENESLFLLDEPDTHLNPAWNPSSSDPQLNYSFFMFKQPPNGIDAIDFLFSENIHMKKFCKTDFLTKLHLYMLLLPYN